MPPAPRTERPDPGGAGSALLPPGAACGPVSPPPPPQQHLVHHHHHPHGGKPLAPAAVADAAFVPRQVARKQGPAAAASFAATARAVATEARLKQVAEAVEELFEDENLATNFNGLRTAMEKNGGEGYYVDISYLLRTIPLAALGVTVETVAEAVQQRSTKLEVNPAKRRVRRRKPYFTMRDPNRDDAVVYVERLPIVIAKGAGCAARVRKMMSAAGPVVDVYFPLCADGRDHPQSGFGFVEFEDERSADRAVEMFDGHPPPADGADGAQQPAPAPLWVMKKSKWHDFADEYREVLNREYKAELQLAAKARRQHEMEQLAAARSAPADDAAEWTGPERPPAASPPRTAPAEPCNSKIVFEDSD